MLPKEKPNLGGGAQKNGVSPEIANAADYIDRIDQESNAISPLGTGLPIPHEVQESPGWLTNTDPSEIPPFWTEQTDRPRMLVR